MDKSYLRIRNFLGLLGVLLPVIAVIGTLISPNRTLPGCYNSISVTYFSTPVLIAILSSVAFFFLCYRSYSVLDMIINTISGISALGVVMFPCTCPWLEEGTKVGMFYLPMEISIIPHVIFAGILFASMAANIMLMFTKGTNKTKNIIYYISGSLLLLSLLLLVLGNILNWTWDFIIVFESTGLFFFGISWLVKGHIFDKFIGE